MKHLLLLILMFCSIFIYGQEYEKIGSVSNSVGKGSDVSKINRGIVAINDHEYRLEESESVLGLSTPPTISNAYVHIYVDNVNGSDEAEGTASDPFYTIKRAIKESPTNGYITMIHLSAGTYNWSEVMQSFRGNPNMYMLIGTVTYTEEVLTETKLGHYVWTTTNNMTPGALAGKWVERIVSTLFYNSVIFPIWNNTQNVFWMAPTSSASLTTGKITEIATVINVDVAYAVGVQNVDFRNLRFESDVPVEFYNASNVSVIMCEFNINTAGYEAVSFNDCFAVDLLGCIINHKPSTTSGDAVEFSRCNTFLCTGNLVINQNTTRAQGIECKQSYGIVSDNIIDGFGAGVKSEESIISLGGQLFNDCSTGAITFEDEGECRYTNYVYAITDSIVIVDDVNYLLTDNMATTSSGRSFNYPGAKLGGTFTFSATHTNLTFDLLNNVYIKVGTGTVTIIDGN